MIHSVAVMELTQPIGSFYLGKIDSDILIRITKTVRRNLNDGIQRELSGKRAKEISKYCEDPDAAFPTPIILAVVESDIKSMSEISGLKDIYQITFDDDHAFAEILDGQHRVEGIKLAKAFHIDLPVVLMFDLTEEEKAYIFSTINSTQTKVDKSLIYDLFDLNQGRSPYKTCHEIARIMNSDSASPFFGRLKMLGKKSTPDAILSQGTFVNYLCKLISNTPQEDMINLKKNRKLKSSDHLVLRDYFITERDDIILKLLTNYFSAVAEVFSEEWNNTSKYILSKTTGYGALMKVFPYFYKKGVDLRSLSQKFFVAEFMNVKSTLQIRDIELTSKDIPSGEQGQSFLAKLIKQASN
ncbi:DGQHR domain-containing protein [Oscillospiraceae bacterium 44-34]